ncbi:hypothetical protein PORCRE_139 [Porphyromonas crevioricanis JCM 15906]|uniref:Uncharacterized protein n=1 Tax=Porphyromonas crevioricanis JCM 15906 TaxID=1305617 RepID=S4NB40_9PORP|nr:hypothetical protein PORCRE_139 [Porphyromonas crevioricanis JCM 15906]
MSFTILVFVFIIDLERLYALGEQIYKRQRPKNHEYVTLLVCGMQEVCFFEGEGARLKKMPSPRKQGKGR